MPSCARVGPICCTSHGHISPSPSTCPHCSFTTSRILSSRELWSPWPPHALLCYLVANEKSSTRLQARRAAARTVGSGRRSCPTNSAMPCPISRPFISALNTRSYVIFVNYRAHSFILPVEIVHVLLVDLLLLAGELRGAESRHGAGRLLGH